MSVVLSKPWYRLTVKETVDFLKVDLKTGLFMDDALKRLKQFGLNENKLLPKSTSHLYKSTVFRDSKLKKIGVENLAKGDIVIIKKGDRVPADLRLLRVNSLIIDENRALGNNVNSYKNTFACKDHSSLENQKCMAFADSIVLEGSGVGVVVETGSSVASNKLNSRNNKNNKLSLRSKLKTYSSKGLFVQNPASLTIIKNVNRLVFYGNFDTDFVLNTIAKIQLHKNIQTFFILNSAQPSLINSIPRQSTLDFNDPSYKNTEILNLKTQINNSNLLLNVSKLDLSKIINIIKQPKNNILLIISEPDMHNLILSSGVSIALGTDIDDKSSLMADIRAVAITPDLIASILHNKK